MRASETAPREGQVGSRMFRRSSDKAGALCPITAVVASPFGCPSRLGERMRQCEARRQVTCILAGIRGLPRTTRNLAA